ncbi:MAG: coproporphyrinogen-III oxidase family protein [Thermoguttaceae bacterium]|jgi:oxygen-independent coproporphyrinogen-3 oxidase
MHSSSHQPIGLYVHVPFCVSKCAYCDFASYAGREADVPRYVDAVIREITRRGAETGHPTADTIFLGGGTPSLLDEGQATRILDALDEAFPIRDCPGIEKPEKGCRRRLQTPIAVGQCRQSATGVASYRFNGTTLSIPEGAEITCECNPGTLTTPFAQALRKAGVNRLSLGAQAKQTRLLRLLGRIHDWQQVIDSVEIAREAGFDNINLDLMLGLPGGGKGDRLLLCEAPGGPFRQKVPVPFSAPQTATDLRETLEAAIALSPTHLSCYSLMVEEGTPICRDIAAGKLALPDEGIDRDMYELARQTLAEHGFQQYEISNFAREGYACRHNIGCWTRVPYLGFGCAAHSFFGECRTMNPSKLDAYLAGEEPKTEHISKEKARFESMMLGLRMTCGVKDEDFTRMHGMRIREAFAEKLDKPIGGGLLEWHEGALRLTRLGMDLENSVLVDLM